MFSQASVILLGWGGGMCRRGHAWQWGVHDRGVDGRGACVAGSMHDGACIAGSMCGRDMHGRGHA